MTRFPDATTNVILNGRNETIPTGYNMAYIWEKNCFRLYDVIGHVILKMLNNSSGIDFQTPADQCDSESA